ncbi:MAG: 1,4-alpha-glucan branching enzyme [Thermoleophilia bacterium]|nr:1,4-alpha-glucan branching enzyme [Thermoleophilia bacterium]
MAKHGRNDDTRALRELARELGVQTEYTDLGGELVRASDAALRSVVGALGVEVATAAESEAALEAWRTRRGRLPIDYVHVVWDGAATPVRLGHGLTGSVRLTLHLEGGEEREIALDRSGSATLPAGLPHGYHDLVLESGSTRAVSRIISAPRHTHSTSHDRTWGLFVPLYAARSERDWGIGDLGTAGDLLDLVDAAGGGLLGSTPLLATFLDEPFEPSPYAPISRTFWNEAYLDVEALPELAASSVARELVRNTAALQQREELRALAHVDHRGVYALKRPVIDACARALLEAEGPRRAAFDRWRTDRALLGEYATFRATLDGSGAAGEHYHQYAQWVMEEQLAALANRGGAGLYLDLPLGVHPDGFDRSHFADLHAPGISIGAPPDPLAEGGQDWGLPPLHPERLRASGYDYQIASIRNLFQHADAARIDHVMGLHRLFWIPSELGAGDGVYVSYAAEEQWAIICLESVRANCVVIGEDLGTVPPVVREQMREHAARRTYVMQFELFPGDVDAPIRPAPADALAAVNTHDTPTWAKVWQGLEPSGRQQLISYLRDRGLLSDGNESSSVPAEAVHDAALKLLAQGDASAVIANVEDFWGETEPQNVPGTGSHDAPNWVRRTARTVEELGRDRELQTLLRELTDLRAGKVPVIESSTEEPSVTMSVAAPTTRVRHDVCLLTAEDIHLFAEGTHNQLHRRLGSHPHEVDGVAGTWFAVWAPNAASVSVVGDFNGWNPEDAPLATAGVTEGSGIWHGWIPGIGSGEHYKYQIVSTVDGYQVQKADPFARLAEIPPHTASVVWDGSYAWEDDAWMTERGAHNSLDAPMSVYELHVGSWMRVPEDGSRSLSWRELAPKLIEYIERTGFTHVQFMPVMEHPFFGSWGYQTTGYFAPSSRFGTPDDFKHLVDELHRAGVGVLLDWVPSHFPTDEHGLAFFDGTHLFEHADPRQGFHPDWKSAIFNYSRNEVRSFLLSSALYWIEEYHVDGLRVDAVASMLYLDYSRKDGEWIPNVHGGRENLEAIDFLRQLNSDAYGKEPDIAMIAEESTAWGGVSRPTWTGGLGFGMKWDMGWMHDTLEYFGRDPIHRQHHHDELSFRQVYAYTENFMLPLSHDEVVHGKGSLLDRMPGDTWQQFANLRLLYAYMWTLPGKKLLFMGCEFGHVEEWDHDSSLDWRLLDRPEHAGVLALIHDLNRIYREEPALHEVDFDPAGFSWVDTSDATGSVYSYLRHGRTPGAPDVLVVLNATPSVHENYRIGVPTAGHWTELLNSDAEQYWGSGSGNFGGVDTTPVPIHGHEWSLNLTLPPLGCVVLRAPSTEDRRA